MGLPDGLISLRREVSGFGIIMAVYPSDYSFAVEIQRAPDDGAGGPDLSAVQNLETLPPGVQILVDKMPASGDTFHYRARHVAEGYADGEWTAWYPVKPDLLPDAIPVPPPEPLMDFDMFVDPVSGEITFYIHGSPRVTEVRPAVAVGSDTFPDPTLATPQETDSDGDLTILMPPVDGNGSPATVEPGVKVKGAVAFYDKKTQLLGILRRQESMGTVLTARPTLDEDDPDLYLYPNRGPYSEAGFWKVYTSGTPTKQDVIDTGTLSTLDEILVHTFSTDGEAVTVAYVPVANTDGTGATGDLWYRPYVYDLDPNRPEISWWRYRPGAGKEGARLVARSDQTTVRIRWRLFDEGDSTPPSFSDTGLESDPLRKDVEVTRPAEGDPNKVLEFYAEDAQGVKSHLQPQRVVFDGNIEPKGTFHGGVDRNTGEPYFEVSTTDPDTGSWRARFSKSGPPNLAFNDSEPSEFKGYQFNGEAADLSSFTLSKGEVLYGVLMFFRTASTSAADQQDSVASNPVRFTLKQKDETGTSIRLGGFQFVFQQGASGPEWTLQVPITVKGHVQSIEVSYKFNNSSRHYVFSASSDVTHTVQDGNGNPQVFGKGDGVNDGFFQTAVSFTPWSGTGGTGTAGEERLVWPYERWSGDEPKAPVPAVLEDGTNAYGGGATIVGKGLALSTESGKPKIRAKVSYGTGTPGTLEDGEVYFQVPSA